MGARKYVTSAMLEFQDCVAYRVNALMWGIVDGLPSLTMALVWLTAYGGRESVGGYDLSQMMTYYMVALGISMLTTPHPEYDLADSIIHGRLSAYLVMPFDRWVQRILGETMWQLVKFAMFMPTFAIALVLVRSYIELDGALARLPAFVVSIVLAYSINIGIKMALGSLSFWVAETGGVIMVVECFWGLLSGEILPLSLLPAWATSLGDWLPFKWVVWFPVELLTGRLDQSMALPGLAAQLGWALASLSASRIVWLKGLRAYTAVGG